MDIGQKVNCHAVSSSFSPCQTQAFLVVWVWHTVPTFFRINVSQLPVSWDSYKPTTTIIFSHTQKKPYNSRARNAGCKQWKEKIQAFEWDFIFLSRKSTQKSKTRPGQCDGSRCAGGAALHKYHWSVILKRWSWRQSYAHFLFLNYTLVRFSFFCKACVDIRTHAFIMKRENDGIKIGSIKSLMENMWEKYITIHCCRWVIFCGQDRFYSYTLKWAHMPLKTWDNIYLEYRKLRYYFLRLYIARLVLRN
jgi:hypothetical protein